MAKKRGKGNTKGRNKKGQEIFGLSFGMIFAVILIIFFVFIAFIVIKQFLCTRDCAKTGIFYQEVSTNVEDAWNADDITKSYTIDLPSNAEAVCFTNLSDISNGGGFYGANKAIGDVLRTYNHQNNLFLYAPKKSCCNFQSDYIKHLDVEAMTTNENPYCIKLTKGVGKYVIDKQNGGSVIITREK